ncbi:MAG: hypothetical protein V3U42_06725 [candidate division NC10 bacterium]
MFRLMLGFFAGLVLGRNCSKLALKMSEVLRQLADRLEALEHGRAHARPAEGEKHLTFKPAA